MALRRSTSIKNSAISSDYIVYLQESDYDFRAADDPQTFLQAVNYSNSKLWYDAMKDEMESMAHNDVWDLAKLSEEVKAIGCKWVYKTKKDLLGNIDVTKLDWLLRKLLRKKASTIMRLLLRIRKKIHLAL